MPAYILILFTFIPFLEILLREHVMSPLFCHLTCLGWYLGYLRGIRVFYSAQHSLQICYTPPTINYASVGLPILMYL